MNHSHRPAAFKHCDILYLLHLRISIISIIITFVIIALLTCLISHTEFSCVTVLLNASYIHLQQYLLHLFTEGCVCLCVREADGQCNLSPLLSSVLLAGV